MRIAITGASGRVGRYLVQSARAGGAEVTAIDRDGAVASGNGVETATVDMADYESVVDAIDGCDALIHLAGIPGPGFHPDHVVHDNNVVASYHALRAAADAGVVRVAQASSVNAIGGRFSTVPRYDYFPLDESHPSYAEDPYSLSKWICEQQADAVARSNPGMSIASLRLHRVVANRDDTMRREADGEDSIVRDLWGYTTFEAVARACLRAIDMDLGGHEVMYVVAPETAAQSSSEELARAHYPRVPIRGGLRGRAGFYDCTKAQRLLGWRHDGD